MRSRSSHLRTLAGCLAASLVLAACGGPEPTPPGDSSPTPEGDPNGLAVAIASFDLAVGDDQRLLAGVLSQERELLAFGEVQFELAPLGDGEATQVEVEHSVSAPFLAVPGMEPSSASSTPRFLSGESGSGVYAGQVSFDQPGLWVLRVVAQPEGGETLQGQTTFNVQAEQQVIGVGDPAPKSTNLTAADVDSGRADPKAIDSRAQSDDGQIPDRHLHGEVIAEVIDDGRPLVVGVTTPVYCRSRFCGPLTNVLADLAERYQESAEFVHLEVWEDFDAGTMNKAAEEWILPSDGSNGGEPWVFLVDGSGTIVQRWDNVLNASELEAALQNL